MLQSNFDERLPLFVYGALKQNEVSWPMIKGYVADPVQSYIRNHKLILVAGLPMAIPQAGSHVQGFELKVSNLDALIQSVEALERVGELYKWVVATGPVGQVNALVPIEVPKSFSEIEDWTMADDAYLGMAIPHVHAILTRLIREPIEPILGKVDYTNFLDLQASYSILWTLFERILTFTRAEFVAGKNNLNYEAHRTAEVASWKIAIESTLMNQKESVSSAKNPFTKEVWLSTRPFSLFYQMRNNILHRGKSSASDYRQLLRVASLFLNVQSAFLQDQYDVVAKSWSQRTDERNSLGFLYQIEIKEIK